MYYFFFYLRSAKGVLRKLTSSSPLSAPKNKYLFFDFSTPPLSLFFSFCLTGVHRDQTFASLVYFRQFGVKEKVRTKMGVGGFPPASSVRPRICNLRKGQFARERALEGEGMRVLLPVLREGSCCVVDIACASLLGTLGSSGSSEHSCP